MAECRLTALCLQYLTFDCFDLETKPERLRSLACQGYLVFQDYAIAYWFYHLGEMVKGADELLDPLSKAQAELDELDVALPEFAEFYEEDIADTDQVEDEIADTDQVEDDIADNDQVEDEITAPFSGRDFYSALKMVMGHVTRHKAKVSPFCSSDPVLQQFKTLWHISCLWLGMSFLTLSFEMIGIRSSKRRESTEPGFCNETK